MSNYKWFATAGRKSPLYIGDRFRVGSFVGICKLHLFGRYALMKVTNGGCL